MLRPRLSGDGWMLLSVESAFGESGPVGKLVPADALVIERDENGQWPAVACHGCHGSGELVVSRCGCGNVRHESHFESLPHADCDGTGMVDEGDVGYVLDALAAAQKGAEE